MRRIAFYLLLALAAGAAWIHLDDHDATRHAAAHLTSAAAPDYCVRTPIVTMRLNRATPRTHSPSTSHKPITSLPPVVNPDLACLATLIVGGASDRPGRFRLTESEQWHNVPHSRKFTPSRYRDQLHPDGNQTTQRERRPDHTITPTTPIGRASFTGAPIEPVSPWRQPLMLPEPLPETPEDLWAVLLRRHPSGLTPALAAQYIAGIHQRQVPRLKTRQATITVLSCLNPRVKFGTRDARNRKVDQVTLHDDHFSYHLMFDPDTGELLDHAKSITSPPETTHRDPGLTFYIVYTQRVRSDKPVIGPPSPALSTES